MVVTRTFAPAIFGYGLGQLDLIHLILAVAAHLVIGWVYVACAVWQLPLQGKSQQGQSDACHQPRLLPQLDLRNRILSVRLPSQGQRPV